MTSTRIVLDEDIPDNLTDTLRLRGINAQHINELRDPIWHGKRRISDQEVCTEVARLPSVLVTCNIRDYGRIEFQKANVQARGIAVIIVRVPKAEARRGAHPAAIHDIVHRWAHRFPAYYQQSPVVVALNRRGPRAFTFNS